MAFRSLGFIAVLLLAQILSGNAANTSLPSYPLAVKNPYLSAWLPGNQLSNLATAQPQFWNGQNLTWSILARVNGKTYSLFGVPSATPGIVAARTLGATYSATHTVFQMEAGPAAVTLDFFSPVFPASADYARQSVPLSYLTVSVTSTQNQTLQVQVLSAIDQTWTAQNGASTLTHSTTSKSSFFTFQNSNEIPFTESGDMATYGTVLFATHTVKSNASSSCNVPSTVFNQFMQSDALISKPICGGHDLAALSQDLGTVAGTSNATFAVGFDRTKAINYLGKTQTGYYRSRWHTIPRVIDFFLGDYRSAATYSWTFDSTVRSRAEAVSDDFGEQYADIIEASIRQTFGAIELTIPIDQLSAKPQVFLKEISSDGNVNTVDVIFQSWPIFISLNPEYIRLLLQPLLSYCALPKSQGWPQPWFIHDIGFAYPNATGHHDGIAEQMPLFETSSLFIMLRAYQKYGGDSKWINQYHGLLESYAQYLVPNSLYPATQLISVDAIPGTPNQTALAIQSAIGLEAAGVITGNSSYATAAARIVDVIYKQALGLDGPTLAASTHFTYNYGASATWNTVFAAFSDVLLGLDTFPASAWDMQSFWYLSQMQPLGLPFAGPVTDLHYTGAPITWGLSDWNIVTAAASSNAVQSVVVNTTHAFLTNGKNTIPFGTKYYVEGPQTGQWIANKARSTVGSNFAIVALKQGTWPDLQAKTSRGHKRPKASRVLRAVSNLGGMFKQR